MNAVMEKQRRAEERAGEKARRQRVKEEEKLLREIRRREKLSRLKTYPTFSLTKNAIWYGLFFVFALLFTQALRSPLSSVLFIFVMLLPPLLVLYVLTCHLFVSESNTVEAETIQKEVPLEYEILIANNGFLPYPFVDADIQYPSSDGVHCETKRVSCSLAPMGTFRILDRAVFHYRGGYEIGIRDLYVYDPLKLFRIRMQRDNLRPVFVMPRRPVIVTDGEGAASEVNTTEVRNLRGADRTELTEIKEYRMGDGLRDIHWKLSSKTQDLMVKHYGMNACRSVCFLPDLGENYTDPYRRGLYTDDINLCCADAVTEMTIALMLSTLRGANNVCTLMWYERRAAEIGMEALLGAHQPSGDKPSEDDAPHIGYAAEVMYNELDFERVYPYFATAGLHDASLSPASLCRFMTETESVSYYIVTSHLDASLVTTLQQSLRDYSSVVLLGGLSVYYFDPIAKIRDPGERARHNEENEHLIAQMRAAGILVTVFNEIK
ncbi:MAG: DUF58 domain-containing protein [Ruminococcaceae bacterium]|nr:DUF58 domain-containing protein [Oscillospiraceae bacterium]